MTGREDFEERRENRIERLENRAAKATAAANELVNRAHNMASVIPFGQPILVGHHSEGRDRNYRARITNTFRRGFETYDKAQTLKQRAASAAGNTDTIFSDDPQAVAKLKEKMAAIQAQHAMLKQAKKHIDAILSAKPSLVQGDDVIQAIREKNPTKTVHDIGSIVYCTYRDNNILGKVIKVQDHGCGMIAHYVLWPRKRKTEHMWGSHLVKVGDGPVESKVKQVDAAGEFAALLALGFSQEQIDAYLKPNCFNRFGISGDELTRLTTEIRRIKERIETLTRRSNDETTETEHDTIYGTVKVVDNVELNRLQVLFPGKPSKEVCQELRRAGFKFSRYDGNAWQRHRSNAAKWLAKDILAKLAKGQE